MLWTYLKQKKQEIMFDIIMIRWVLTFFILAIYNIFYSDIFYILSYSSCFFLCFLAVFYFERGKTSNGTKSYMINIPLSEET